jgi:PKD repeat protein
MDKRILILIAIFIFGSASLLAYRKIYYKPEGISYEIKPLGAIRAGDSIVFNDKTKGASRWKWDFGDGEFSADQSGSHVYLSPGKFEVTLTAYGPFGVQKKSDMVTVTGNDIMASPAPTSIAGPAEVRAGSAASWESGTKADSYEWKVEGDAALAANTQKGNTATYTFKSAGQRTLVLTTKNPDAVTRRSVTVMGAEPVAKPVTTASAIPMPPQHAQTAKPKPVHHDAPKQKGNALDDLGDGVEIKK